MFDKGLLLQDTMRSEQAYLLENRGEIDLEASGLAGESGYLEAGLMGTDASLYDQLA